MEEYIHEDLSEEVRSISGYYLYLEEGTISFKGRDILYLAGVGVVDNSCCGAGGFPFVRVPGYVVSWKDKKDSEGHAISTIEPVKEAADRQEIQKLIDSKHPYSQISFS
ncbi:MAG: hypothetical protein Q7J01_00590 [Syntrophales bacterium]|nr:hypothetical protein [Syntrophales bacterium]